MTTIHNHITINVNVPAPESEAQRFVRCAQGWAAMMETMAKNRIAYEQAQGNPLFTSIQTWDQYVSACAADEKCKRKELGFWRYHFGG